MGKYYIIVKFIDIPNEFKDLLESIADKLARNYKGSWIEGSVYTGAGCFRFQNRASRLAFINNISEEVSKTGGVTSLESYESK